MAKRNTVTLVLALTAMASLSAAVFFGAMEIQAKRLGSWQAAMSYPRPIVVVTATANPTAPTEIRLTTGR